MPKVVASDLNPGAQVTVVLKTPEGAHNRVYLSEGPVDANGGLVLDLIPNEHILPSGTTYVVAVGDDETYEITVPANSAVRHDINDLVVDNPDSDEEVAEVVAESFAEQTPGGAPATPDSDISLNAVAEDAAEDAGDVEVPSEQEDEEVDEDADEDEEVPAIAAGEEEDVHGY